MKGKMDNEMFEFVVALAKKAGKYAYEKSNNLIINHKGSDIRDVVTNIDVEIDEMLQKEILEKYPDHAIYSEESEGVSSDSEYRWALDPVDGTSNYARGIPNYATCVSVLKGGDIYIGAVYNPVTDECFAVDVDGVVTMNEKPIQVSDVNVLQNAYVNFHPGRNEAYRTWAGEMKVNLLHHAKKSLNLGSSALDLCYVASGRMDILIYGTLTLLDVAGAVQILRAAGGEVYNYETKMPAEITNNRQRIVATNSKELLEDFFRQTEG